jgi:hypothetical protein
MSSGFVKALAAIAVSAAGALVVALGTGATTVEDLDAKSWLIAGIAVLGSGGMVWIVENVEGVAGGVMKAVVAFLTAGFGSLVVALDDDVITQAEWLTAFAAAALATGFVYQLTSGDDTEPQA